MSAPRGFRTQRQRLLDLFLGQPNTWVPLPSIRELGIAQYGTRIKELRSLGFNIENRKEHQAGTWHTWFRLRVGVPSTSALPKSETAQAPVAKTPAQPLLPMMAPEQTYQDPEEQGVR